ncbi:MAG: YIP1 family protein [Calditrichia bacterium]|nr:YIP1 family protein [Calditrichia bacterium]
MLCKSCGEEFQYNEGMRFCPKCGVPIPENSANMETVDEAVNGTPAPQPQVPWEDKNLTIFERFWITFKESVFNPTEFYKKMPPKGELFMPLLYAVTWIVISQIIGFFYLKIFGGSIFEIIREVMEAQGIPMDQAFNLDAIYMQGVAQLFMLPFLFMLMIFVIAGIMHLLLLMFGAGKEGYIATFRVIAYSQGSAIFNIIPFMGNMIASIWGIVLQIVGFKETHKTSYGKVVVAIIVIPLVLCVFCCIIFFVMIAGIAGLNA